MAWSEQGTVLKTRLEPGILAALDDRHVVSGFRQIPGGRHADNAATHDDGLHGASRLLEFVLGRDDASSDAGLAVPIAMGNARRAVWRSFSYGGHPMVSVREPILHPIAIEALRPTQITVGMREVEAKRRAWRQKKDRRASEFLGQHMIPVILGPKERYYIIDHHHLARALHEEGVNEVLVTVIASLKQLERDAFWFVLENRNWMHAFDDRGRRRGYDDIPKSVDRLIDDPFRSLAGELRLAGGFAKDTTPFSEFLWADFLCRRIRRKLVERDCDRALQLALKFARIEEADYLPGWCGPVARRGASD